MLEDELRAAKAELESGRASHRADLVEREAELEEKVRATREEFQRQLEEIEASYRSQLEQREAELRGRISDAETAADTARPRPRRRCGTRSRRSRRGGQPRATAPRSARRDRSDPRQSSRVTPPRSRSARPRSVKRARKPTTCGARSTALQDDLARADGTIEELRGELEAERLAQRRDRGRHDEGRS